MAPEISGVLYSPSCPSPDELKAQLDLIRASSLKREARFLAELALASGLPIGLGPDGGPLYPPMGHRIHPALIFGGWIQPAKGNLATRPEGEKRIVLGLPPGFRSEASEGDRVVASLNSRWLPPSPFFTSLVVVPRVLGVRHARLLACLLLNIIAICVGKSLEFVLSEQMKRPYFRQWINQPDLHRMVGRDLSMNAVLDVLDEVRQSSWSIPFRCRTSQKSGCAYDILLPIPGITAVLDQKKDGTAWRERRFDTEQLGNQEDYLYYGPYIARGRRCRREVSIIWDSRILGWCWSTYKFITKRSPSIDLETIFKVHDNLVEESRPMILRERLLDLMTGVPREQRFISLHQAGILQSVYGSSQHPGELKKTIERALAH